MGVQSVLRAAQRPTRLERCVSVTKDFKAAAPHAVRWDAGAEPLVRHPPEWAGIPINLFELPSENVARDVYFPETIIGVAHVGTGKRWYRDGIHRFERYTAPRMVEVGFEGMQFAEIQHQGTSGSIITLELTGAILGRLLRDSALHYRLEATRSETFNDEVCNLVGLLWKEAASQSPNGPLFAEGLSIALLGLLNAHFGATPVQASQARGKLHPRERERLKCFIDSDLGGPLTVERMACVVGLSPYHFSRVFKATFGLSPHAYVMERRIDLARQVLRQQPGQTVSDIAIACGFSSNAHFTTEFRRRFGITPSLWRRQA